jgi:hypothetical protein
MLIASNITPQALGDLYIRKYGYKASLEFFKNIQIYNINFAREVAMHISDFGNPSSTIEWCKYCGRFSLWDGYEDHPTYWCCEKCGESFCDDYIHISIEDEKVLCGDCRINEFTGEERI